MRGLLLGAVMVAALLSGFPATSDATVPLGSTIVERVGPKWNFNGTECNLISTKMSTPFGAPLSACSGVRPGAFVSSVIGGCTFNFLFHDIHTTDIYAGTAGHCIVPESSPGEYTSFANPWANATVNGVATHIGNFVYGRLDNQFDFGLIKLNAAGLSVANPQMCHFGGPTGLRRGEVPFGEVLKHYGNGLLIGELVPARSHVTLFSDPYSVMTASFGAVGDSGSGLTDSAGRATAVLVAGISSASPVLLHSRLDTHLDLAATRLGKTLVVVPGALL